MALKIPVSFKEDVPEEILLYNLIKNKSGQSAFIKETLMSALGIKQSLINRNETMIAQVEKEDQEDLCDF